MQTPDKNEVMKAALVSLVLMGGFSVCAGVDRESLSKKYMSRFILRCNQPFMSLEKTAWILYDNSGSGKLGDVSF